MRLLEDVLAEELLSGRVNDGDNIYVDVDDSGKITVLPSEPLHKQLPQLAYTNN
jgi:ATP-dependent Clp protease ATP-binding subunit ClpC